MPITWPRSRAGAQDLGFSSSDQPSDPGTYKDTRISHPGINPRGPGLSPPLSSLPSLVMSLSLLLLISFCTLELLLETHYCNPSRHGSSHAMHKYHSDPFQRNHGDLGQGSLPVSYEMMTPKPIAGFLILQPLLACLTYVKWLALLPHLALTWTSWVASLKERSLMTPPRSYSQCMQIWDWKPSFPPPELVACHHTMLAPNGPSLPSRSLEWSIEFNINNCSSISRKTSS